MAPELGSLCIAARAGYGAVLLLASRGVLSQFSGVPCDAAAVRVARVLGVREVVQAGVLYARRGSDWQLGGAVVDVLHGISMLTLAVARPRYRRLAVGNARDAGILALSCLVPAPGPK